MGTRCCRKKERQRQKERKKERKAYPIEGHQVPPLAHHPLQVGVGAQHACSSPGAGVSGQVGASGRGQRQGRAAGVGGSSARMQHHHGRSGSRGEDRCTHLRPRAPRPLPPLRSPPPMWQILTVAFPLISRQPCIPAAGVCSRGGAGVGRVGWVPGGERQGCASRGGTGGRGRVRSSSSSSSSRRERTAGAAIGGQELRAGQAVPGSQTRSPRPWQPQAPTLRACSCRLAAGRCGKHATAQRWHCGSAATMVLWQSCNGGTVAGLQRWIPRLYGSHVRTAHTATHVGCRDPGGRLHCHSLHCHSRRGPRSRGGSTGSCRGGRWG